MLDRMPRFDDEEPFGVHFFRMIVDSSLDARNLTLPRTFISRCELSDVAFTGSDLSESSLCWNDFLGVDFSDAALSRCDMRASIFHGVKFLRADLTGADLRHSSFEDCDFDAAIMNGTKLSHEQLDGLMLSDVQRDQLAIIDAGDEPPGG